MAMGRPGDAAAVEGWPGGRRQKAAPCCEARRGSFDIAVGASGSARALSFSGTTTNDALSRPDLHSLLALQLRRVGVARSPPERWSDGRGAPLSLTGRTRREGGKRGRTLCRETILRTPPSPPRKLFLPPSEFTAGGQESKPRAAGDFKPEGIAHNFPR